MFAGAPSDIFEGNCISDRVFDLLSGQESLEIPLYFNPSLFEFQVYKGVCKGI